MPVPRCTRRSDRPAAPTPLAVGASWSGTILRGPGSGCPFAVHYENVEPWTHVSNLLTDLQGNAGGEQYSRRSTAWRRVIATNAMSRRLERESARLKKCERLHSYWAATSNRDGARKSAIPCPKHTPNGVTRLPIGGRRQLSAISSCLYLANARSEDRKRLVV